MEVFQILPEGKIKNSRVTKKSLADRFDMHIRDLRPVFLPRQLFTLAVRGQGIVVNVGSLKLIIGNDQAFLLRTGNESLKQSFLDRIQLALEKKEELLEIPFEMRTLEEVFQVVIEQSISHYETFEKRLENTLKEIRNVPSQHNLETLLTLKNEIARMEKSILELQKSLNEILDDDDEMQDILFSKKQFPEFLEDDVESVLDNILEQVMEIGNKIVEKKENIDDAQEIITLKLAAIRNSIIQFDLLATLGTAILAIGTLISGFYGMNLLNHTEKNQNAFFIVVAIVVTFSLLLSLFLFRYMKKRNILSF